MVADEKVVEKENSELLKKKPFKMFLWYSFSFREACEAFLVKLS